MVFWYYRFDSLDVKPVQRTAHPLGCKVVFLGFLKNFHSTFFTPMARELSGRILTSTSCISLTLMATVETHWELQVHNLGSEASK